MNFTALARRACCRNWTAVEHVAAGAGQVDASTIAGHAARFDNAFVVDHAGKHISRRHCRHQNLAAFCGNRSAVVHCRFTPETVLEQFSFHGKLQQSIAIEIDRDYLACSKIDRTEIGDDRALVIHATAKQVDGTAVRSRKQAVIDDQSAGIAIGTAERPVAIHEIIVVDIQRGYEQAARVDAGRLTEKETVRVDQQYAAVGIDGAPDLGRIDIVNPVQGSGIAGRLQEIHGLVAGNI